MTLWVESRHQSSSGLCPLLPHQILSKVAKYFERPDPTQATLVSAVEFGITLGNVSVKVVPTPGLEVM